MDIACAGLTVRLLNINIKQEFTMSLEGYEVWLIIILVLGVIASNIAVLKYSAKFKMPQFGGHKDKELNPEQKNESEELDKESSTKEDKDSKDKTL
jgi:hypothetical protein